MGTKFIKKWAGRELENSCCVTEELKEFYKDFRTFLKNTLKNTNCELVSYTKGHFFVSGFVTNKTTQKIAYFNLSDLRFFNWSKQILYRTAEHVKDYTGGNNRYTTIENLATELVKITQ